MADLLPLSAAVFLAGAFGLLIGSFLNVVIYRLPRDLSIVRPRSHCPQCEHQVRAWDNIPLISYLLLRGKCRDCGAPIPVRYPLVELATALLFAWFVATQGITLVALKDCILAALFLTLTVTDLETRLLPEPLTVGGIAIGIAFSLFTPVNDGSAGALGLIGWQASLVDALIGAFLPAFLLWSMGWIYEKIRGVQGLGFGDVVMVAEAGAFLGGQAALLTLVLASIAGSVIGSIFIWQNRKDHRVYELPLGSFLGISGIVVASAGRLFMSWYGSFF